MENSIFQALFNYGNGKVSEVLKGSKHYRDFVLPKVYKYCVIAIQQKLSDCQHLSFTCDVGSGPNCSFFASVNDVSHYKSSSALG